MLNESHRVLLVAVILVLASAMLGFMTTPSLASTTPSAEPRTFTVIVSRYGFNGTAGTFSITVQQGDSVKITFVYGDNDLTVDNPHAIMFDGYRIQTVNIGKSNPSVTVEFVADVSGTFNFYCYIPCLGMENLLGHLIVTPKQGQRAPTTLDLSLPIASPESTSFQITATVRDENGKAMVGVPVTFYENTTFGRLFLGTVPTDSMGVAVLNYEPSRMGNIQLIAENLGNAQYAYSSKSILIKVASGTTNAEGEIYLGIKQANQPSALFYGISYPPNLSMIGVPRLINIIVVILAGIVLLGVWSTYAYVGRQIASIRQYGEHIQVVKTPYLPATEIPADTRETISLEIAKSSKSLLSLFLIVPILGVVDMLLMNTLNLPMLWKALSVVTLAAFESSAIVTLISRQTDS